MLPDVACSHGKLKTSDRREGAPTRRVVSLFTRTENEQQIVLPAYATHTLSLSLSLSLSLFILTFRRRYLLFAREVRRMRRSQPRPRNRDRPPSPPSTKNLLDFRSGNRFVTPPPTTPVDRNSPTVNEERAVSRTIGNLLSFRPRMK